ncbi:putative protein, contains double-stranded beta-helix domain [Handroanthus impetiginosus]|uniref:Acireductone dioxygenase n=1 Tax=Handroanthus impetiginosus TaxID=429701 RepID=A0A2G9GLW1_9LAMI|nr:putative protein, contains double-stranded beta-helix domain [Handroanthus impetiginosus]
MQESDDDQRLPHHKNPPEYVSLDQLADLGVLYWHLDPAKYDNDPELNKIRQARGYSYMDELTMKLEKHIHADEEIRYCLEGSGYFDDWDKTDRWIRILIKAGDLIVLPTGIYHRFTLDTSNYIKLIGLFVGEPVWTPFNRPQEDHPIRKEYIKSLIEKGGLSVKAH